MNIALHNLTKELEESFSKLIRQYGFSLLIVDENRLELATAECRVSISLERYEYGFTVTIYDLCEPSGLEYHYPYVMYIRCHEYPHNVRRYNDELSPDRNFICDMTDLADKLTYWCSDMLAGDFSNIREPYKAFVSFVEVNTPKVVNLPAGDPIKEKFWKGDYTWIRDLRLRDESNL